MFCLGLNQYWLNTFREMDVRGADLIARFDADRMVHAELQIQPGGVCVYVCVLTFKAEFQCRAISVFILILKSCVHFKLFL